MANSKGKSTGKVLARIGVLGIAGLSLSGCYGLDEFGLGYASGYYGDSYYCDPYSAYDSYYDCDYGYGFNNIGYGGGWYDNYYYPGYGVYVFDGYGKRHDMGDRHRRYWSGKRHDWQKGRGGDRGHGWSGGNHRPDGNGWNGGNGNWNRGDDGRKDGGNWGRGRNNRNDDGDRGGKGNWRGNGNGWKGGNRDGNGAMIAPQPRPDNPGRGGNGRGWGNGNNGGGNRGYTPPSAPSVQQAPPAPRAAPAPRNNDGGKGRVIHPRNGNVREN